MLVLDSTYHSVTYCLKLINLIIIDLKGSTILENA